MAITTEGKHDVVFTDKRLHSAAKRQAKQRFKIFPSAYASAYLVKVYKKLYKEKHGSTEGAFQEDDDKLRGDSLEKMADIFTASQVVFNIDNLEQWFNESWVRISSSGEILGECGGREEGEGKPKCLPRARAEGMTKAARAAAVRRKREADPDPEREGQSRNVATTVDTLPKPQPL